MTENGHKMQQTNLAEIASDYANKNGLNIVSDLFGKRFVVQQEGQQAFKIARLDMLTKRLVLAQPTYPELDRAVKEAMKLSKVDAATEAIASVPDEKVIEAHCRLTGEKASDNVHAGYVTLSKPVHDRKRKWMVHKRVGTKLVPLDVLAPDRWAANAKVKALGGEAPTTMLQGHFVFPFGNNFARPVRSVQLPEERDGKAA